MIRDLERELPTADDVAEFCIVGAGAVGIALAVELVRLGKRVLVLEGGGADVEERSQEPYASEVVGHEHRGIHSGRFRAQGGTTKRWGGQILELDAIDFAERPWVKGSGWPIAKAELLPFYERALEIEGVRGAIAGDGDVWSALKIAEPQFTGVDPFFTRWCPDPDFARVHRGTLNGPSVELWLHANVVRMEMSGDRVDAVVARTLDGREAKFCAKHFIFALGAIECTRFFLQPREGGLPWNASGLLGKYFQDHIDCNAATVVPRDAVAFHRMVDNVFLRGYKYHPKLKLAAALQEERETLNVAATMSFSSDVEETLGELKATAKKVRRGHFGEIEGSEIVGLMRNAPLLMRQVWRYAVAHRAYNSGSATISLRVHCEQEPMGESSITLSGDRDRLGMLRTRLDWRIADTELRTMQIFVEQARDALTGVADVAANEALKRGGDALRERCDDSNHHMGGMKMDDSPALGVVATDLRLHGTANCFVASSAVFPTSGFSNPTHTAIALAMRLAAKLTQR